MLASALAPLDGFGSCESDVELLVWTIEFAVDVDSAVDHLSCDVDSLGQGDVDDHVGVFVLR